MGEGGYRLEEAYDEGHDDEGRAPSRLRVAPTLDAEDAAYAGRRTSRRELHSASETEADTSGDEGGAHGEGSDGGVSDDGEDLVAAAMGSGDASDGGSSDESSIAASELAASSSDEGDGDGGGVQGGALAQLEELERAERAAVAQLAGDPEADARKGKSILAQFALWDQAVESRIRLQRVVGLASRLPRCGHRPSLRAPARLPTALPKARQTTRRTRRRRLPRWPRPRRR